MLNFTSRRCRTAREGLLSQGFLRAVFMHLPTVLRVIVIVVLVCVYKRRGMLSLGVYCFRLVVKVNSRVFLCFIGVCFCVCVCVCVFVFVCLFFGCLFQRFFDMLITFSGANVTQTLCIYSVRTPTVRKENWYHRLCEWRQKIIICCHHHHHNHYHYHHY